MAFYASDVAATREKLMARGARFGSLRDTGTLVRCDGKDPDGNWVQLSSR